MDILTGDILSRVTDTGRPILIVVPVARDCADDTPFASRAKRSFPRFAQDCADRAAILGANVHGDVCLTSCLDSHGYILAGIFCVGPKGLRVPDLRKGLEYLAARLPDDRYKFPEHMGLDEMAPGVQAFVEAAVGHTMWANGVKTEFQHWSRESVRADEQFTVMRRAWMEANPNSDDMLGDDVALDKCHMLWLAFCVRTRLVPDTVEYKQTLVKLCSCCGDLNVNTRPVMGLYSEYDTLYELMTADVPRSYQDDMYTPANSVDDIAFIHGFIDRVARDRKPEQRDATLICALLTAYFYGHGIHKGHPDYGILMDSVMSSIQRRKALYRLYQDRRMWTERLTCHLPDTRTLRRVQLID